ncbi:hypothetical protein ABBQ32_14174 [Trebouxia sp. C0010 RCD-2024]
MLASHKVLSAVMTLTPTPSSPKGVGCALFFAAGMGHRSGTSKAQAASGCRGPIISPDGWPLTMSAAYIQCIRTHAHMQPNQCHITKVQPNIQKSYAGYMLCLLPISYEAHSKLGSFSMLKIFWKAP